MSEYIHNTTREHQDTRGLIRTFTGRYVNPLALRASDVCLRDIAHHLSLETRYAGACPWHYPVAQHCVLGTEYFTDPVYKLAFLFHDSAEYVLKDIPSPVKRDPRMKWYRDLEHETTRMIYCVFGLDPDLLREMKEIDNEMFRLEAWSFWGCPGKNEFGVVRKWTPYEAEMKFLSCFYTNYQEPVPCQLSKKSSPQAC